MYLAHIWNVFYKKHANLIKIVTKIYKNFYLKIDDFFHLFLLCTQKYVIPWNVKNKTFLTRKKYSKIHLYILLTFKKN